MNKYFTNIIKHVNSENVHGLIDFDSWINDAIKNPRKHFRDVYQLFYDFIKNSVPKGIDEYPDDPESIDYVSYDYDNLFVTDFENPFFPDRILMNKLMKVIESMKWGVMKNKMIVLSGPSGSGKSTLLNNLLEKLEKFTYQDDGAMYETIWKFDCNLLNNGKPFKKETEEKEILWAKCPNHCHPIIQIPKKYRKDFLETLFDGHKLKNKFLNSNEYEWLFEAQCCPICSSIQNLILEQCSFEEILQMIYVKRYLYSRKHGEGITIFNQGDKSENEIVHNDEVQGWINSIFNDSHAIDYVYSSLSRTNNGIFALMDLKYENEDRLKSLHGIISDGVHKVENYEEPIKSIFITIMNPEDDTRMGLGWYKNKDAFSSHDSYLDRILIIDIPFIRDYKTETKLYTGIYKHNIEKYFLPNVLEFFARTVICSRITHDEALKQWITNMKDYINICDSDLRILLLEIYAGNIPIWLNKKDKSKFSKEVRENIINEGKKQGFVGISGRQSLFLISEFFNKYKKKDDYIDINDVINFFKERTASNKTLMALNTYYDYTIIQEIKDSMFNYNETQIETDIKDYLFCLTLDDDQEERCPFTGNLITRGSEFIQNIELKMFGYKINIETFRTEILNVFVSKTIHQIKSGIDLKDTEQFKELKEQYNHNLKQNVLAPFAENPNFRTAIKEWGTPKFDNHDWRIKNEVEFLLNNLQKKYGYTEKGAIKLTMYLLDSDIAEFYYEEIKESSETSIDDIPF